MLMSQSGKSIKGLIRRCRSQEFKDLGSYLPKRKVKGMFRRVLDNSLPSRMRLLGFNPPTLYALVDHQSI